MLVRIKIFLDVMQRQLQIFTGIKSTIFYILNTYFLWCRPLWSSIRHNISQKPPLFHCKFSKCFIERRRQFLRQNLFWAMVECYPQVIPKYSEKTLTCPAATWSANKPTALRGMLKTNWRRTWHHRNSFQVDSQHRRIKILLLWL